MKLLVLVLSTVCLFFLTATDAQFIPASNAVCRTIDDCPKNHACHVAIDGLIRCHYIDPTNKYQKYAGPFEATPEGLRKWAKIEEAEVKRRIQQANGFRMAEKKEFY